MFSILILLIMTVESEYKLKYIMKILIQCVVLRELFKVFERARSEMIYF